MPTIATSESCKGKAQTQSIVLHLARLIENAKYTYSTRGVSSYGDPDYPHEVPDATLAESKYNAHTQNPKHGRKSCWTTVSTFCSLEHPGISPSEEWSLLKNSKISSRRMESPSKWRGIRSQIFQRFIGSRLSGCREDASVWLDRSDMQW